MPLPQLPFAEDEESEDPLQNNLLLREGVRDFGARRTTGWRTLKGR